LIVFAVGPRARELDPVRHAIVLHRRVHENAIVVRIEPENIDWQPHSHLRQHLGQQGLFPKKKRHAFGPSRGDISEHQGLDKAAV
jgi:hypothetical protein